MTISTALNNALSGLNAAGRASDIVAMNVSNATTPGYGRRELEISATSANLIGGVTVNGVIRIENPAIVAARREADSDLGHATTISNFLTRLEVQVGTPDSAGALTNLIADFEAKLLTSSSRPDSVERLDSVVASASDLVSSIQDSSKRITQLRTDADSNIDTMITRLNAALEEVEDLNTKIAEVNISGLDDSALLDLRQGVVDEINELVPIREAQRDHGKVALYSTGGVVLIDGSAREVDFTPANLVTPYMTLSAGHLSGLTMDGFIVNTDTSNGGFPGGAIAAEFAVRDTLGVDAMAQLDAFTRNLVERFQDSSVDPTLAVGDPGLLTDSGLFFDPLNEVGISERINLNSAVDPTQGGETWRIRDGMNAAVSGPVGQSSLIDALRGALTQQILPSSGDFGTGLQSTTDIASSMLSRIGVQRLTADQTMTFAAVAHHEMAQIERASGVDTDAEMQRLIMVEQAYAANARVFDTVQNMMDVLMRLGS